MKTLGDGIMAAFPAAPAGVLCAKGIQEEVARRNVAHPDDAVTSGIGIAWGTPIEEDGDLFGFVVNLAQRLADRARGGQILVSPSVVERTAGEGIRYLYLGTHELKGLGPQEIYELIWRDEIARITTKEGRLNLILTKDALVVELGKAVQEQVQLVRKLLSDRAGRRRGLRGFLTNQTVGFLERRIPQMVDRALFQAGFGLEHPLTDVTASFSRNTLTVEIRGHRGIRLGPKDVDPWLAAEFVAKLSQLKAGLVQ
ncbi:MAG: adenylate/guanylate cyclase domain-containing protein [Candidatus Bipolaricaulis sp.]